MRQLENMRQLAGSRGPLARRVGDRQWRGRRAEMAPWVSKARIL